MIDMKKVFLATDSDDCDCSDRATGRLDTGIERDAEGAVGVTSSKSATEFGVGFLPVGEGGMSHITRPEQPGYARRW